MVKATYYKQPNFFRAELNDRRWKRRCNAENVTFIGIMFRLLYKNQPERLLDVLDMATIYIGEGASKDEATLQNLKVRSFYESEHLGFCQPD